jgi:NitT/TauT family transport system substrate-binding protein
MAVQSENFATIPLFLSQDLGFMKNEGLSIETTVGQSTSTMTAGLLGGSFDMQIGGAELLVARQQGAPIVAFAGLNNSPVWSVIARNGVASLADLRGKTIATSGPDSVSTVALIATLKQVGIQPSEYQQITAGGTAERFVAVQQGRADATVVAAPQEFQAADEGMTNLGSLADALPQFAAGFVVATSDFAKSHSAEMDGFSRAWLKTFQWIHDPANKADLVNRVSTKLQVPAPIIEKAYDHLMSGKRSGMFPISGKIDPAALEGAVQAFADTGSLPLSKQDITGFIVDDYIDRVGGGS